jgi:hypothetical protein
MKQATSPVKKKVRRRTKAQMEADRRLLALRKNLTKEIEADFDRFSRSKPSVAAGLMVMTRMRIILAFLQAFFPMFITAPKPRKVTRAKKRKTGSSQGRKTVKRAKVGRKKAVVKSSRIRTGSKGSSGGKIPKNSIRVIRLEQEGAGSGVNKVSVAPRSESMTPSAFNPEGAGGAFSERAPSGKEVVERRTPIKPKVETSSRDSR